MKAIIVTIITFFSFSANSQTRDELIKYYQAERAKMMQEIRKMFQDDFSGMAQMDDSIQTKKGVIVKEQVEKDGTMSVFILPQDPNLKLDISIENNYIIVKSEMTKKEEVKENGMSYFSSSSSSSSQSVSIPKGYEALSPEQIEGGVKISLVESSGKLKKDKKITPLIKKKPIKSKDTVDVI